MSILSLYDSLTIFFICLREVNEMCAQFRSGGGGVGGCGGGGGGRNVMLIGTQLKVTTHNSAAQR